jgi:hypothetical protein
VALNSPRLIAARIASSPYPKSARICGSVSASSAGSASTASAASSVATVARAVASAASREAREFRPPPSRGGHDAQARHRFVRPSALARHGRAFPDETRSVGEHSADRSRSSPLFRVLLLSQRGADAPWATSCCTRTSHVTRASEYGQVEAETRPNLARESAVWGLRLYKIGPAGAPRLAEASARA